MPDEHRSFLLIIQGLVLAATLAVPIRSGAAAPGADGPRTDFVLVPYGNYSSDMSLGLGLNTAIYLRDPGWTPYRYSLRGQVYANFGGLQSHALFFDAPRLWGSAWRTMANAGYFREANHPYYGVGNTSSGAVAAGIDKRHDLTFDLHNWHAAISAQRSVGPAWKVGLEYSLRVSSIEADPRSLLRRRQPIGDHGGLISQVEAEIDYDTRDLEMSPTRGVLGTLALRGAGAATGSRFNYGGFTLALHGYKALLDHGPRLVLAGRVVFDGLVGGVPVELLPQFGGHVRALEGVGGAVSVRGLDRFRYTGKVRLLGNGEVRSRLARWHFGIRPLDLWVAGFCDVGRVWAQWAADGPLWRVHPSGGGGVRLAYVEDYLLRFDAGFSETGLGMYVEFGQAF